MLGRDPGRYNLGRSANRYDMGRNENRNDVPRIMPQYGSGPLTGSSGTGHAATPGGMGGAQPSGGPPRNRTVSTPLPTFDQFQQMRGRLGGGGARAPVTGGPGPMVNQLPQSNLAEIQARVQQLLQGQGVGPGGPRPPGPQTGGPGPVAPPVVNHPRPQFFGGQQPEPPLPPEPDPNRGSLLQALYSGGGGAGAAHLGLNRGQYNPFTWMG